METVHLIRRPRISLLLLRNPMVAQHRGDVNTLPCTLPERSTNFEGRAANEITQCFPRPTDMSDQRGVAL